MGQSITASTSTRDGSVAFALYAAQDVNYVDFSDIQNEKIVIIAKNTNDAVAVETATITISPGDAGLAWRKDLGTLTIEIADANSMAQIGPLDSARFKGTSGNVTINVAVTQSGTVSSVQLGVINLP
jgi:nitrous oxide reductase